MFENYNTPYIESYIVANLADMQAASALVFPYTQEDCYLQMQSLYKYLKAKGSTKIDFPVDFFSTIGFNLVVASLTGPVDNPSNLYNVVKLIAVAYLGAEGENGTKDDNPFTQMINDFLSGHSTDIVNICTAAASFDDCVYCSEALLIIENWSTLYGITIPSAISDAQDALKDAFDLLTITTPDDLIKSTTVVDNLRRIAENEQKVLITEI